MALVQQELWLPDEAKMYGRAAHDPLFKAKGCVTVTFPDPDPASFATRVQTLLQTGCWNANPVITFQIPLLPELIQNYDVGFRVRSFKMHKRIARGLDFGGIPEIAAALPKLKKFLKIPQRQELMLLRCNDGLLTRADTNLAPLRNIGEPAMIGYVDQQPVHLVSLPAVHAVSNLLPPENKPLDARRFRANMYLTGCPAYEEETWKRYRVHRNRSIRDDKNEKISPTFSVVCRTSRCTMPNVIPEKGVFEEQRPQEGRKKGKAQPSSTLVEYRTVETGNPAALGYMGMHCVPEDLALETASNLGSAIWINVDDEIEVLETGTHLFGSTANEY